MTKYLVENKFKGTVERVMKSYMTAGKDIKVLSYLFKLSGVIDGLMINEGEIKASQILLKVQASKYASLNDSVE